MARFIIISLLSLCCICCQNSQKSPPVEVASTTSHQADYASKNGEWLKAAQLYEQLYQESPNNEEWNYEAGTNYLRANYPQKALKIFNDFDIKKEKKSKEFNGRIARIAKAYYQIGAYQKIETLVKNYDYPKMYRGLAREHLKGLIQLTKTADLATSFSNYQKEKIYDDKGKSTNMGFLYRAICNEFLIIGNTELLKEYAAKYHKWALSRQEKDKRNLAFATFYLQNFEQSIPILSTAIATEKSARHRMELEGLLGICYANTKAFEKAEVQIEKIQKFEELPHRHDAFGAKFYHQARIEVALNQQENAMQSLKNAIAGKAAFWSNRFKEDGLLKNMFNRKGFKTLVQSKVVPAKNN